MAKISVLEAIQAVEAAPGCEIAHEYIDQAPAGGHVCDISNSAKMHSHFPNWHVSRKLEHIVQKMCKAAFAGCIV